MTEPDILTRLRQRVAQWNAAIATIEAEMGMSTPSDGNGPAKVTPRASNEVAHAGIPGEVHTGAFLGMSTPKAVLRYLAIVKKAQSPRQIADALIAGGQVHAIDPQTAYLNAYSALKRMKNDKVAQTQAGDWGLIEWYGGRPPKPKAAKGSGDDSED